MFKCMLKSQFITKCDVYVSKTEGLEKLFRLGQYSSKLVYLYTRLPIVNHLTSHFRFLFKCISIFKLFNFFNQVVKAEEHFRQWSLMAWMILLKCYSLFLWKLFDVLNVLQCFEITLLSLPMSKKWQKVTNYCWLSTLFWTLAINISYLYTYEKDIRLTKKSLHKTNSTKNNILLKTKRKHLRIHYCQRTVVFRKIILTFLDVIVVLKLLNLIEGYDFLITFFGVITSIEGIKDVWRSS